MSCGVSHRHGSELELLWLWCRPEATALIKPLAWEPPYATRAALEKAKRQKKKCASIYLYQNQRSPIRGIDFSSDSWTDALSREPSEYKTAFLSYSYTYCVTLDKTFVSLYLWPME